LLPWPDELPRDAAKYVYKEIADGLTAVNDPLRELLRKLRASTQDHSLFVRCGRKRGYVRFGPDAVGLHIEDNGSHRWLLQRDRLTLLGIAQQNFRTVCKQMVEHGVIARSGNTSATVQERVIDEVGRGSKMRFWILNIDKLPAAE